VTGLAHAAVAADLGFVPVVFEAVVSAGGADRDEDDQHDRGEQEP
jgi:hypothetical protein